MYTQMVKMVFIDLFEFMSVIVGILFYYFKMTPFVSAAITLGYVNGQTLSYALFALLLIALPAVLLFQFKYANKGAVLRYIFYSFAAVIMLGTISDIIKYNGFINYTYIEGDAVFVNLMWNIPNMFGVIISIIISALYFFLGKQIKRSRTNSYILYVAVFIMSHAPAFLYSLMSTGSLPRNAFLQKDLYVMLAQLLLFISLSIAATSRSIWQKQIWQ